MLLVNGSDDFVRCDAVGGHHVRFYPDTHTVSVTDELGKTHTSDAAYSWYYVDVQVVGDEFLIKSVVGAF